MHYESDDFEHWDWPYMVIVAFDKSKQNIQIVRMQTDSQRSMNQQQLLSEQACGFQRVRAVPNIWRCFDL
jgi:hypothetical protein